LSASGDRERLARLYWRATRYLVAASVPLAAFLVVAAPALVVAWLGPGHRPVALATAAIGVFLLVTVMTGVCTAALRGMEQPWLEARYHMVGIALHLGLSLWLVPRRGLDGALIAMLGSGVVSAGYLIWAFHRRIGEPLRRWLTTFGWPLALSLAAAVIATRWPGTGWSEPPAARLDAAVRLGEVGAIFLAIVTAGYVLTGFVPYRELRSLAGGALGGAMADTEPR
jgi:O-antigen/teichoic acid export membrane protein